MKLLTLIYDAAIDTSLMELLEEMEVTGWTKTYQSEGLGCAGFKLNTPIWPGTNNQILIAGEEGYLRQISAAIRSMQSDYKLRPGIFMALQEVEEL
ncbi:MAG TPA: hypothetical protein VFJ58_02225 [Armatimonadota bacterium]|nr:hypothetical protein [Armatimonadota bacterium]